MSDWLEDAEGKQPRKPTPEKIISHIEQRRKLIESNYQLFGRQYDDFITQVSRLVSRVNNLPAAAREPFGKLEARAKKSKLDNNLFIISSAHRFKKRKSKGFFRWFGYQHFKHVRVIYFSVSKHEGKADIEIKDYVLEKHRLGVKGQNKTTLHDHFMSDAEIGNLDQLKARKIIDWLAFKAETNELPFDLHLSGL